MLFWLAADRATALRANSSGVLREMNLACVATKSDADQAVLSSTRESRFVRDQSRGSNMITEWASASTASRGMNTNLGLTLKTILLIRARRRRILQTRPKAVNYKNVDLRAGTKMQTNYNLQRQRSVLSREFSPLFCLPRSFVACKNSLLKYYFARQRSHGKLSNATARTWGAYGPTVKLR